jgi:hypothetical protein
LERKAKRIIKFENFGANGIKVANGENTDMEICTGLTKQ